MLLIPVNNPKIHSIIPRVGEYWLLVRFKKNSADNSQPTEDSSSPSLRETFGISSYHFSKWKVVLLSIACLMTLGGGYLEYQSRAVSASSSSEKGKGSVKGMPGMSFTEESNESNSTIIVGKSSKFDTQSLHGYAPFMLKGGFGFFVGFTMGFAVRSFFKLALVICGFYFITLAMFSYTGWVEVHWDVIQSQFEIWSGQVQEEVVSFKSFMTGTIPATGMLAAGLATGLKKK